MWENIFLLPYSPLPLDLDMGHAPISSQIRCSDLQSTHAEEGRILQHCLSSFTVDAPLFRTCAAFGSFDGIGSKEHLLQVSHPDSNSSCGDIPRKLLSPTGHVNHWDSHTLTRREERDGWGYRRENISSTQAFK